MRRSLCFASFHAHCLRSLLALNLARAADAPQR